MDSVLNRLRSALAAAFALLCLLGMAWAGPALGADAAAAPADAPPGAQIEVLNRSIATLNASAFGFTPQQRAEAAARRIRQALAAPGALEVTTQGAPEGARVLIDGKVMFAITTDDAAERSLDSAKADALDAAGVLQVVVQESRESRDYRALLRSAGVVLLATAVLAGLIVLLARVRRRAEAWFQSKTETHADRLRVGGIELVRRDRLVWGERLALRVVFWLVVVLLVYEWLSIGFAQFPYTRVWSEQLNAFLVGVLTSFALAIVHAVPNLLIAVLIFALAYGSSKVLKAFFENVQAGRIKLSWLDAEVVPPTARLCSVAIWLFALAMAYPYLPGSQTEAFKGVSVVLGLMISLGASSLVGQAFSGLILTYTRTFRNGEFVRVAEHEGTVLNLGTFTTRIRTGMGEELTISNSQVLGAVTRNYSRAVKGPGFIVDTTVTIGYDTPWRQVNALLVQAALRTPGVLADPPPHVFQTALSDYYPEYRLVCQAVPTDPRPRAVVMSELHANIQDLFNEYGVQIMSPHYRGDPAQPKLVPPEHWHDAPAMPPVAPKA